MCLCVMRINLLKMLLSSSTLKKQATVSSSINGVYLADYTELSGTMPKIRFNVYKIFFLHDVFISFVGVSE